MTPLGHLRSWGRAVDPRGRLARRAYVRVVAKAFAACAALLCVAIWLAASGFRIAAALVFAGNLVVVSWLLASTVRRLHDRNRSGWWLGLSIVLYGASFAPIEAAVDRYPFAVVGGTVTILVYLAWFLIETFLRRGTPGPNRFGPA